MEQDWLWGLLGGALIGTAAAMFLLLNGRIMGASGLIGGLVDGSGKSNATERWAFLAGLLLIPAALAFAAGGSATYLTDNALVIAAGGLLVGIGTRLANGCTSGHGVCGLGRRSKRSLFATVVFMSTAVITTYAVRHLWVLA